MYFSRYILHEKASCRQCSLICADLMTVSLKVFQGIITCSLCIRLNIIISQNTQNKIDSCNMDLVTAGETVIFYFTGMNQKR